MKCSSSCCCILSSITYNDTIYVLIAIEPWFAWHVVYWTKVTRNATTSPKWKLEKSTVGSQLSVEWTTQWGQRLFIIARIFFFIINYYVYKLLLLLSFRLWLYCLLCSGGGRNPIKLSVRINFDWCRVVSCIAV